MLRTSFVVVASLLAAFVASKPLDTEFILQEDATYGVSISSFSGETIVAIPPMPIAIDVLDADFGNEAAEYLANAYLDLHNAARSKHGARPLTWSNELANKAQNWANHCQFKHSGAGENLAAGTGNYGPQNAVQGWMDEQPQYNPGNPQPSHFTQVVWKSTTQLGCAVKVCPPGSIFPPKFGNTNYHVCEYAPPGNVIGHFPENVQK